MDERKHPVRPCEEAAKRCACSAICQKEKSGLSLSDSDISNLHDALGRRFEIVGISPIAAHRETPNGTLKTEMYDQPTADSWRKRFL